MKTDTPYLQVTRIAPDGRTIEPLALELSITHDNRQRCECGRVVQ